MPVAIQTAAYACRYCLEGIYPWHWRHQNGKVNCHIEKEKVAQHENTHRSVLESEYRAKRLAREAKQVLAKEFGVEWQVRWRRIFLLALRLSNLYSKGGPFLFTMGLNYDLREFLVYNTPSGRPIVESRRDGKFVRLPVSPVRKYVDAAFENANKPGIGQPAKPLDQQLVDLWEVVNELVRETRGLHQETARYFHGSQQSLGEGLEMAQWAIKRSVKEWNETHEELVLSAAEPIELPAEKNRVA